MSALYLFKLSPKMDKNPRKSCQTTSIGMYPGKKSAETVVRPKIEAISAIAFWTEEVSCNASLPCWLQLRHSWVW
jgi:hypothetical protein